MPGPIATFLTQDHDRLDSLLRRALATPGQVEREAYDAFRAGLLRHIALEEKILLPAARDARGGEPLPVARRLRVEHGALTSLLVPTPTPEIAAEITSILGPHNDVEECPGGMYETCDALLAGVAADLVTRMRAYPEVKVASYKDGPAVHRTAASALASSALQVDRTSPARRGEEIAMPLTIEQVVSAYEAGAGKHVNGKSLAGLPGAAWATVQDASVERIGSVTVRDSARRQWGVDVRRDGRGRYLQFRPVGIDMERFRASADGHLPEEWLPITPIEWTAFALFAAGAHDGQGHVEDEELAVQVARAVDRMVREAQHRGVVFDEDEN